ncbi:ATP-dependent DNA helicase UvrD2 [Myceligenerans halotolerans]
MVTHAPALSNSATGPVHPDSILDALDPEQREVALALRGPVCVLAGAGTGKTRALTHRIAYGVRTGIYKPNSVLAVTFTARAAGEMRTRLRGLGVQGVQARTFHAAALRQMAYFWPRVVGGAPPRLVEHKAQFVAESARRLGLSVDRVAVRDLSSEIEWAKAQVLAADDYERVAVARGREAPSGYNRQEIARLMTMYEDVKTERQAMDFEDVLLNLTAMLIEHKAVADEVRGQYRHFVVDEYQDVSRLQQKLLDQWLGGREELCVVGDPSQTIYSFTGASPRYLLDFRRRFRNATEIRLVRDYRSTPQVVGLANDLLRRAGRGAAQALELVAQRDPGPPVTFTTHDDDEAEATAIATRAARLIESGTPASEIAVLYRTNAQSEAFESALADAGVGYLVRGGERFFQRKEVRDAIVLLRGAARSADPERTMPDQVRDVLAAAGWATEPPAARGAARERWDSMQALVALADDLAAAADADAPATIATLVDELTERAKAQHAPTVEGVTLASLHAAKGLEWDAVFLAGMSEGLMPISLAETDEAVHEERRLLYVGITRARERLDVSFARSRNPGGRATRKRTRFLDGIWPDGGSRGPRRPRGGQGKARAVLGDEHDVVLFDALREWRLEVAQEADKPAYTILTDASLAEIAEMRPGSVAELARVNGVGPGKIDRYGPTILSIVSSAPGA